MKNWQKTRNYRSMKDENGNVLSDAQLHRVLDRVLRKTKIDKPFTLHQLRHTFATRALKAGGSVARLNARGPQGRLVLQDTALDGSGAFRSANQAPCTVWPRTDSAANHAKYIQGLTASPNLPDARNRAP